MTLPVSEAIAGMASEHGFLYFDINSKTWIPCFPEFFENRAIIGRHIIEDNGGIVWMCTEGAGLVKLDYTKQEVKIVEKLLEVSTNFRYVLEDGNHLWIATDNGVVVYDHVKDEIIQHISLGHIQHSNVCYSIQKDQSGDYWVGTNFGLLKIEGHDYKLQYYNLHNGLGFLEYNTASVLAEDNGSLVFGGVGGMTKFNPQELKLNLYSPDPIITSVQVNNQFVETHTSNNAMFDHRNNHITFSYTANNFSNQERNKFFYRVLGLTEDWTDNRYHHSTTFNSLSPGEYTFQVRSANSDGILSENTADYSFKIHPPWWESWWFMAVLLCSVGLISGIIIKKRLSNIRNKAELKQRIIETEMMALRAQMNPHFIFNCLNSIDAFIQSNNKYQATTYLNKFARLLRNVLDCSRQTTVTFSKDLETLKLYLELEQLRHSNKFRTEFVVDKMLLNDDFQVPPLLIQPYVENAILHGLKHRCDNGGILKISAHKSNDKIHYIIEDNGVGRNSNFNETHRKENSYGMKMTSDRVRYFNQEKKASVVVTDLSENEHDTGTKIEVFLVLK